MATTPDFIEFVCDQIESSWNPRYRKMFGEYMVYVNDKPLFLVCDNTVFVKELDDIKDMMKDAEKGFPYDGAKEHYIVDVENRERLNDIIAVLEKIIPVPCKRKPKNQQPRRTNKG
jgi:TfoX/Sxy family transcriptional regulator of competence genes